MENGNCCKTNMVTQEQVDAAIEHESYMTIGEKTTICLLTLKNGFEVVGTSACVDPKNYDLEVGKPFAKEKAMAQVWMHLASIMQDKMAEEKQCCNEEVPMEAA